MRVGFVIIALGVAGCSALTSLDDLSQQTSDGSTLDASGSDVQTNDASSGSDVVQTNDASDAGGGNLVTNGGFENGLAAAARTGATATA